MDFKAGDKVICKPGFTSRIHDKSIPTGGAGYELNKIFTIDHITKDDTKLDYIAWPKHGSGIYFQALELYVEKKYKPRKLEL